MRQDTENPRYEQLLTERIRLGRLYVDTMSHGRPFSWQVTPRSGCTFRPRASGRKSYPARRNLSIRAELSSRPISAAPTPKAAADTTSSGRTRTPSERPNEAWRRGLAGGGPSTTFTKEPVTPAASAYLSLCGTRSATSRRAVANASGSSVVDSTIPMPSPGGSHHTDVCPDRSSRSPRTPP